jgi:RNA polymerase sigma-70 factor (sigma-E family)
MADGPAMDITTLFRQHYAELVRLAVMLVGDRPTAEDVVQEVFAKLHARRDRLRPRGDPLAYVRACVLNACRTTLRRRAVLRPFGGRGPLPDLPHESAEHEVIQAEGRRQVLAALATLPRRRREVLVLRYYLGLREAEIAEVLGITPGTVKSTAARGLGALARALGEES